MCRSYKAFSGFILTLGICFMMTTGVNAESLQGYDITSGDNGGSYLPINGKIVVSGGEVTVSGSSNVPINITGDVILILKNVTINSGNGAAIVVDSGVRAEIVLEGNNVVTGQGNGAGINVGFSNNGDMASLTISGDGSLKVTGGEKGGAGIGGNGTEDAHAVNGNIIIDGGKITAAAQMNGAGIGGGFGSKSLVTKGLKAGEIIVNGGNISATGKNGSAGIGGGNYVNSKITIEDGVLNKINGGDYAAGIGGGNCNENVAIEINGGKFSEVKGYESSEGEMLGGAVIGSGAKMCAVNTKTKLTISGGVVEDAVAGWGAAGIGSGAGNQVSSEILVGKDVQISGLYTDGEKMPLEEGANIEGNLLQAAFAASVDTNKESSFEVVNYNDESEAYKMDMPKGYRAFATTVKKEAEYSVRGSKYYADESLEGSDEKIKLNVERGALVAYSNLEPVEDVPERKVLSAFEQEGEAKEFGAWIFLAVIGVVLVGYIVASSIMSRARR